MQQDAVLPWFIMLALPVLGFGAAVWLLAAWLKWRRQRRQRRR